MNALVKLFRPDLVLTFHWPYDDMSFDGVNAHDGFVIAALCRHWMTSVRFGDSPAELN